MAPIHLNPPPGDCAEISLFGPGIGECIVIHYGNGRWFIIDSCLCPDTKQPIALRYLQSIGVDVASQVEGILITHWHADHIKGAFKLLEQCESAQFHVPLALSSKEAANLLGLYSKDVFANTDKEIREYVNIVNHLRETGARHRLEPVKAKDTLFDLRDGIPTRLLALSPSPVAITQSISKLVASIPNSGSFRLRPVVASGPNHNAIALHFSFGDFSALLGSDLEETGNQNTGWSAILGGKLIKTLSISPSSVYKVAHHGSSNGHHDSLPERLLTDKPLSIGTPFTPSKLPTPEHIQRICGYSSQFIVTRDPHAKKRVKRGGMVDRELEAIVKDRKSINDRMGHVRLRIAADASTSIAANECCVKY